MPQDRDERGRYAAGGGTQPRGGRGWKKAGTKKKTGGKTAKAKKAVGNAARRADQAAGQKGASIARRLVKKVVKKIEKEPLI
jgi:hypothetical protein